MPKRLVRMIGGPADGVRSFQPEPLPMRIPVTESLHVIGEPDPLETTHYYDLEHREVQFKSGTLVRPCYVYAAQTQEVL